MTPEEFANCFAKEKDSSLQLYFDADSRSDVARQIASLSGDAAQSAALQEIDAAGEPLFQPEPLH